MMNWGKRIQWIENDNVPKFNRIIIYYCDRIVCIATKNVHKPQSSQGASLKLTFIEHLFKTWGTCSKFSDPYDKKSCPTDAFQIDRYL